jgi:hypothetical protein
MSATVDGHYHYINHMTENNSLDGPQIDLRTTDQREVDRSPGLEQTVLADGSHVINAFLPNADAVTITPEERYAALDALNAAIATAPALVKSLSTMKLAEARDAVAKYRNPDQMNKAA